jgi:hypothetical protein
MYVAMSTSACSGTAVQPRENRSFAIRAKKSEIGFFAQSTPKASPSPRFDLYSSKVKA